MRFEGLKKTYKGRCVLDIPALELESGRIYAVIGANGSGKSTMARICAGILPADGGYVKADASVGYMPQKPYAFKMTTAKNLRINGKDREREAELLRELKISDLAGERADKLSGGETARMALARLLMRDYELLILDEPSSPMDIEATLLTEKLVRATRDRTGCTVLIVTHSVAQAERLADEVLFLANGELIERGSPNLLLHHPTDPKTAEFIEFYAK